MELAVCLGFALVVFIGVLTFVIGLISAPTPLLVIILIFGLMLTQKSINKFSESNINLLEERDKDKIETVEIAVDSSKTEIIKETENQVSNEMRYRGFHYQKTQRVTEELLIKPKVKTGTKYRGISIFEKNSTIS